MSRPNVVSRRPRKIERRLDSLRWRPWFFGKQLSTDWGAEYFLLWRRVLSPLRNQPRRILEIGSWEGRSTLFFLNFFRRSTITCIDTFAGGEEHHTNRDWAAELPKIESRFDHNLAPFGSRVKKLKGSSKDGLRFLAERRRRFDLAYIHGSHTHDDVLADSVAVWPLIDRGGVIIWDDYNYCPHLPPNQRPGGAIDAFLSEHVDSYRQLAVGYQLIIEKVPAPTYARRVHPDRFAGGSSRPGTA
jgi:cephalosporin hydroxylase